MKKMDQNEFMASQQLKKMIPQLLLSVSLFSFVFSYSSLYTFHYFSGNSFQLLSTALNKNCLFLICNGLLVFLSKTSGLIRPPPGHDVDDALQKGTNDSLQAALEKYVLEEVTCEAKQEEDGEEERDETGEEAKEVSIFIAESEEEGGGGGACDLEDDQEKDEDRPETRRCWLFNDEDEQQLYGEEVDEEDDEEREEMITKELNQKFEDFIRRMKEEIIINEARQKLVMVK